MVLDCVFQLQIYVIIGIKANFLCLFFYFQSEKHIFVPC